MLLSSISSHTIISSSTFCFHPLLSHFACFQTLLSHFAFIPRFRVVVTFDSIFFYLILLLSLTISCYIVAMVRLTSLAGCPSLTITSNIPNYNPLLPLLTIISLLSHLTSFPYYHTAVSYYHLFINIPNYNPLLPLLTIISLLSHLTITSYYHVLLPSLTIISLTFGPSGLPSMSILMIAHHSSLGWSSDLIVL
jgi:hypothetical protein